MYAGVLNNKVIILSETFEKYPPDILGRPVITVQCDPGIKLGMIYNLATGEFAEPATPEPESTPEIYQESERMSAYTKGVESIG